MVFKTLLGNVKGQLGLFKHTIILDGHSSEKITVFTVINTDSTPITKNDLKNILSYDSNGWGASGFMTQMVAENPPYMRYPASIFTDWNDPEDNYATLYAISNINNEEVTIAYGYATTTDESYTLTDVVDAF